MTPEVSEVEFPTFICCERLARKLDIYDRAFSFMPRLAAALATQLCGALSNALQKLKVITSYE